VRVFLKSKREGAEGSNVIEVASAGRILGSGAIESAERLDPSSTVQNDDAANATVQALSRALELRDYCRGQFAETREHSDAVTFMAMRLAERVAPELTRDPQLEHGFRLHDTGLLAIPDAILSKNAPLTAAEREEICEHPWLGERIVAGIPSLGGIARHVIGCHHERWDGSGYPRQLAGTDIPLAARIFSVADAFDAMTRDRPWRRALPLEIAISEIGGTVGTHFDPTVAKAFLEIAHELHAVRDDTR